MTRFQVVPVDRKQASGVWSHRLSLPYESAYSLLQKYMWLNVATGFEVVQRLFGLKRPQAIGPYYELLHGNWIKSDRCRIPQGMRITQGLLPHYGSSWPRLLASGAHLRFCELCLNQGFHSILFQIEVLKRCPIHSNPLTVACQYCGQPSAALAIYREGSDLPFKCHACKHELIKHFNPTLWFQDDSTLRRVHTALAPVADWIARLEKQFPNPPSRELPFEQLGIAIHSAAQSNEEACAHFGTHIVPLELPSHLVCNSVRPLSYRRIKTHGSLKPVREVRDRFQLMKHRYAIVKSIRRHFLRTHLRAHRVCVFRATLQAHWQTIQGNSYVIHDAIDCPLAAGFAHWRMNYTRLYRKLYWLQGSLLFVVENRDANELIWSIGVLAEFYSAVVTAVSCANRSASNSLNGRGQIDRLLNHCGIARFGASIWEVKDRTDNDTKGRDGYAVASTDVRILDLLRKHNLLVCKRQHFE